MANWEELPQRILKLIACRLAIEDLLAFRGVCTSWQSAATKETYKAKLKALCLMTDAYNNVAKFSSLSTGRIYPVRLPGSLAQTLSALGWILVSEGASEHRIFNPLSRVSIELPALEKLHRESRLSAELDGLKRLWYGRGIDKMALSSSPSLSRSYTVMISYTGSQWFAFHRSGEDAWTVVSPVTDLIRFTALRLIYYDGLFVALDAGGQIMTLNERERRMESRLFLGLSYLEGVPYLVECSGSLLVAWKMEGEKNDGPVKKIRVFKVDLEKGTKEEVKSLGNASLFLSGNSSLSVEFNAESCLPGIEPNRVYFPDDQDDNMKSYSMEDGKVETYFDATSRYIYEAQWFRPGF